MHPKCVLLKSLLCVGTLGMCVLFVCVCIQGRFMAVGECMCVCVCVCVCVCMFVWMQECGCVSVCAYVCVPLCDCLHVHVCLYAWTNVVVCVYLCELYVCMWMFVDVCRHEQHTHIMCMFVSVRKW